MTTKILNMVLAISFLFASCAFASEDPCPSLKNRNDIRSYIETYGKPVKFFFTGEGRIYLQFKGENGNIFTEQKVDSTHVDDGTCIVNERIAKLNIENPEKYNLFSAEAITVENNKKYKVRHYFSKINLKPSYLIEDL